MFNLLNFKIHPKAIVLFLAMALTFLTGVLGAPFLFILRRTSQRLFYYGIGIIFSVSLGLFGFISQAITFIFIVFLIGIYIEFEKKFSMLKSVFLSLIIGSIFAFSFLMIWQQVQDVQIIEQLKTWIQPFLSKMVKNPQDVDIDNLILQIPSGFVVGMLFCLGLGIIFEERFANVFGFEWRVQDRDLKNIRLPSILIWILIFSFLFSFMNFNLVWLEGLALNLMNLFVALYFFQGLAIVVSFIYHYKIGPFLQIIIYVLIIIQMFLLVSVIGMADFWVDFRAKMAKKSQSDDL